VAEFCAAALLLELDKINREEQIIPALCFIAMASLQGLSALGTGCG